MKYLLLFLSTSFIALSSCTNSSHNESDHAVNNSSEDETEERRYSDGEYCATVTYNNPNTGTESTYTLTVEVDNNEVTVIHWPNGGWLDESHFTPEELDDNGTVNFTSDKGYEYTVEIDSKGPCSYSSNGTENPEESDEEAERKHIDEEEGVVIWGHMSCDYVIIETGLWYVVAEKGRGAFMLGKGSRVRGDLITFGFEDVYSFSGDDEISLYIDNYYGTKSRALERVIEKCDLVKQEEE